jgi:hypothetical protein
MQLSTIYMKRGEPREVVIHGSTGHGRGKERLLAAWTYRYVDKDFGKEERFWRQKQ